MRTVEGSGDPGFISPEVWARCVQRITDDKLAELAAWRDYSIDFCRRLRDQKAIGIHDYHGHENCWAFPNIDTDGDIVSIHCRLAPKGEAAKAEWRYDPKGTSINPFIRGDLSKAEFVVLGESQWDTLMAEDKLGPGAPRRAFVATRGATAAGNALLKVHIPDYTEIYLLAQNDEAGKKWVSQVSATLKRPVHVLQCPSPHKDLNDWGRNGLTPDALTKAIEEAPILEPLAESGEEWNERKKREGRENAQQQAQQQEDQLFEELLARYEVSVCTSEELETLPITPRKRVLGNWMKEGDTGFVYGERGSGKTWFTDAIAVHISTGRELQGWEVPEAVNVLIVDGEMPIDDFRDRLKGMSPVNKRLHLLHHEALFDKTGLVMNLTDARSQQIITRLCIQKKIKLLILDNLSCLFSGLKENDADAWELVLNWLLDLRRRRIAVLIVHHASRTGTMRGTSKREDSAFWVIRVDEVKGRSPNEKGARFQTTFTKQRNSASPEWTREWTFQTESDGQISIGCTELSFDSKVLQLIQDGVTSASDIADELGVARSTVSKAANRLKAERLIENNGRHYRPRGFMNT